MKDMLDKILQIEKKYKELGETLSDPAVIQDYNRFFLAENKKKVCERELRLYIKLLEWQRLYLFRTTV